MLQAYFMIATDLILCHAGKQGRYITKIGICLEHRLKNREKKKKERWYFLISKE